MKALSLSLFLGLLLLVACECEDLVPSEPLEVPATLTVIPDGAGGSADGATVFASFDFTAPLDTATVELGSSVRVDGDVAGKIGLALSTDGVRLFLNIPIGSCPGPPCGKSLTFSLSGTGARPIRDLDGRILDGDYDNSDGGDYVLRQDY